MSIIDNGKGIPEEILNKLGHQEISYGKEGIESGSGIGLFHARQTLEKYKGQLEISSKLGEGTIVQITLPREKTPSWFVETIKLSPQLKVVGVDDDLSIHQIWRGRLASLDLLGTVEYISFTSTKTFTEWLMTQKNEQPTSLEQMLFLVDYEFLGEQLSGLDLIEQHEIKHKSILVTSRFEEPHVRLRCEKNNLKLIPKSMAGLVPMQMEQAKSKPNAVLIDDDILVHMTWQSYAREHNKSYALFFTVDDFLKDKDRFDLQTPIYVDSNLAGGVKGEVASEAIFRAGFNNIFLATGYAADDVNTPNWIKGVVGKEPISSDE